jgi:hypothetical protein
MAVRETKTIYGDGTNLVHVTQDQVHIHQGVNVVVTLSRATFREIVIGWKRLLEEEEEDEEI